MSHLFKQTEATLLDTLVKCDLAEPQIPTQLGSVITKTDKASLGKNKNAPHEVSRQCMSLKSFCELLLKEMLTVSSQLTYQNDA